MGRHFKRVPKANPNWEIPKYMHDKNTNSKSTQPKHCSCEVS